MLYYIFYVLFGGGKNNEKKITNRICQSYSYRNNIFVLHGSTM